MRSVPESLDVPMEVEVNKPDSADRIDRRKSTADSARTRGCNVYTPHSLISGAGATLATLTS